MNVCIAIPFLSAHGGAERVVCEEARYFSDRGSDVIILTTDHNPSVTDGYGVPAEIDVVEMDGSLHTDVWQIKNLLREQNIDVVFTNSFTKRVYLATRLANTRTPYVPHVHGTVLWFVDHPNRLPLEGRPEYRELVSEVPGHGEFYRELDASVLSRARATASQRIEARGLRKARRVTTGSERVRREVRKLYGVDASVVRPGVSQSWIDEYESVEERTLSDHEHIVLSVSRLDPRKRVDLLVKAVARLREDGHDVGLVVAGTGDERDSLERQVRRLDVESAVTFEGYVTESDLASYYKSADVFACPGWMSYGITPLEAYAMRTPVALSTDAYVQEVLGEDPSVEVVEPTVEEWTSALPALFDCDLDQFDPSLVPTWDEFCQTMYGLATELSRSPE